MSRRREYASNAVRQAAYRQRKRDQLLATTPHVQIGDCTLYQGDGLRLVPLLSGYDHCLTDPPYEAEAHTLRRSRAMLEGRAPRHTPGFPPLTEPQRRLFGQMRCQWLLIFCQAEAIALYQAVFGSKYRRPLAWVKPDSMPQFSGDRPAMGYESIVCAWGQPGHCSWNAEGKRGIYTHLVRAGEPRVHPTQKPIPLLAELLRDFTQPGEVIVDPFMGAGSTGVACLREQRRFIGIELDPTYFALACDRLTAEARQGQLFDQSRRSTARDQIALLA